MAKTRKQLNKIEHCVYCKKRIKLSKGSGESVSYTPGIGWSHLDCEYPELEKERQTYTL